MSSLSSLWPGLNGVLRYGRWPFLIVALIFAALLDAVLVLNFYWSGFLSSGGGFGLLVILFIAWIVLLIAASGIGKWIDLAVASDDKTNLFHAAIGHYLRGNWFETECGLNAILKKNPRDIEAILMLATLFRHTHRYDEAINAHKMLDKLEGGSYWYVEIENEKSLTAKAIKEALEEPPQDNGPPIQG